MKNTPALRRGQLDSGFSTVWVVVVLLLSALAAAGWLVKSGKMPQLMRKLDGLLGVEGRSERYQPDYFAEASQHPPAGEEPPVAQAAEQPDQARAAEPVLQAQPARAANSLSLSASLSRVRRPGGRRRRLRSGPRDHHPAQAPAISQP
ncbi:Uncharacterised protein [Chromobacterium violaceum]|uniref:Uncharacterized protein n=1 Tax=Chromobacterium violaceum TaxID=536 RepID=A0A3S4JXH1_CHRVL|nr:Uncharacterised protein [Chromobacterium violaceum]